MYTTETNITHSCAFLHSIVLSRETLIYSLRASLLEKTKGREHLSINVNEGGGGGILGIRTGDRSEYCARSGNIKHFLVFFFDACDGIGGRSRSELPGFSPLLFAIHRFDTVGRYVGEHPLRRHEGTRGYAVALTHAHLPIFPPSPRYLPFFMTPPFPRTPPPRSFISYPEPPRDSSRF